MPGGGSVYQPTTVSYEPRSDGTVGPLLRKPRPQIALLLFALISLAAGVAMIASGTADWLNAEQEYAAEKDVNDAERNSENVIVCADMPLGLMLGGVFMTCLGLVGIGVYIKYADWRRNCICPCPFFDKKQSLARSLQCQNGGGCGQGIMALNPSTDPLVSHTQYAPVSELPLLRPEDEERRNLMHDNNKDCVSSAEESDRMLEPDPRIVLRPSVEDA